MSVKVVKEVTSGGGDSAISLFALHADVSEDKAHLLLVVLCEVLPELDDDWFEIVVDVVSLTDDCNDIQG